MTEQTPAAWAVDSQVEQTKVGANNVLVEGMSISFHTGHGHTGTVFVPLTQYRPDTVRAAVQAQADLLDAVGQLQSGMA